MLGRDDRNSRDALMNPGHCPASSTSAGGGETSPNTVGRPAGKDGRSTCHRCESNETPPLEDPISLPNHETQPEEHNEGSDQTTHGNSAWPSGNYSGDDNYHRNVPHNVPPAPTTAVVNVHVTDPTMYTPERYELYKKELLCWRDIHHGISDRQLIGMLALKAEGVIKAIMVQYMEATRNQVGYRTLKQVISTMDNELAKTAQETSMAKIGIWSSFARKNEESIRLYWMRWQKLEQSLSKSGITFPDAVSYHRALSGLRMRQPSLGVLLGTLESQKAVNSIAELRRLSIKLFETSFIENPEDAVTAERAETNPSGETTSEEPPSMGIR